MNKKFPKPVVEKVNNVFVVRDDMFEGGTKRRAFELLINDIQENELVYACDYYGHAAYAIALTALDHGKVVQLFYPSPKYETDVFRKTILLPHVKYEIVNLPTQVAISDSAKKYAKEKGAKFLEIGLDFEVFREKLIDVVKEAEIPSTAPEVWVLGGSGNLARALSKAYPTIEVKVVNLGTSNGYFADLEVFDAPELLDEKAEIPPPFTSSPNYDAKVWRFVLTKAKPGAYVWNVA